LQALLDYNRLNPFSRLPNTKYKSLEVEFVDKKNAKQTLTRTSSCTWRTTS
jgi:hypothetical protein